MKTWAVLAIFAAALAVQISFLTGKSMFVSADGTFHHASVSQVAAAQAEGVLYPRWMPGQNGGLGDVTFMHYPPLFHTLAALLRPVAGGTAWGGMRAVFLLATFLTGWVAYGWMRAYFPPPRALAAAIAIAANPLFLHLLLKAEAYPWACSLPLVILFFRLLRGVDGSRPVLLPLAAIVAAQCFLHTITAFMLLVSAPVALAISGWLTGATIRQTFLRMVQFGLSALLGLGMAGVYLIPALATLRYATPTAWEFQQVCSPVQSFALPLFSAWQNGMCWSSYQILFPVLSLFLLATGAWAWRRGGAPAEPWAPAMADLLGFGGVALLIASEAAWPLWKVSSTLRMVQFPFRFNFVALAALLPVAVLLLGRVPAWRWQRLFPAALAAVSLLLTGVLILQALRGPTIPAPADRMQLTGMGSLAEYRPATAKPAFRDYLDRGGFSADCAGRGAECRVVRQRSTLQEFRVRTTGPMAIRIPLFCYPAWQVMRGGEKSATACDTATGLLEVQAAAGDNDFLVRWEPLPEERTGQWCSMAGLAVFLVLGVAGRVRRRASRAGVQ